jgi:hypothetical protein
MPIVLAACWASSSCQAPSERDQVCETVIRHMIDRHDKMIEDFQKPVPEPLLDAAFRVRFVLVRNDPAATKRLAKRLTGGRLPVRILSDWPTDASLRESLNKYLAKNEQEFVSPVATNNTTLVRSRSKKDGKLFMGEAQPAYFGGCEFSIDSLTLDGDSATVVCQICRGYLAATGYEYRLRREQGIWKVVSFKETWLS